ncbi:diguanylate cyclase [Hippea maritima]|uniref:diguanylate cyclase n=1 Tax=Hippea maritima (strain ATCC 700847 / DSM 10411 / MH2) TaxID=760142 RepID=F2LX29_HIPMA|nr:diguanylate cyclase [Hippea maritima]AEA33087.1 diguanylate cyclase [Hippea maritima DSM 10411]
MEELKGWFFSRSIKFKILFSYLISIILIGIIGYSYYVMGNIKSIKREAAIYRKNLEDNQKKMVRNVVNIALDGIDKYYDAYKNKEMSEEEAIKKSIEFINAIRYNIGKNINVYDYVWINTLDGVMVLDPPKPELNGKNVWNFKDKNGVYLFREMARVIETQGGGFVEYCWPKLGSNSKGCYPKVSYVGYFYPWKWVVGSGFYLDDLDKAVDGFLKRKEKDMFITTVNSLIAGGLISVVAGFVFFFIVSCITNRLREVGELSKKLAEEEVSPQLKLPYKGDDELGILVKNFNDFIDESYKLMLFKKTIEEDVDVNAVYRRLFDLLKDDFGIRQFNVYEVNNSKSSMKQIIVYETEKMACKQDILLSCNLCRCVRTAKEVDSFVEKNVCLSFIEHDKNHVCIPLLVGGTVGSVVQLIFEEKQKTKEIEKKIKRVKVFLKEAAPVIEAKRLLSQLKESTMRDPLTGLYNRRFLDEFAATFSATVKRRNTLAGILMCDVDFFKQVNDVYGHNVGDEVLRGVVRAIAKSIRESDIAVRFGGEEFLVLLQDVDEKSVLEIAERIRSDVEKTEITVQGNVIKKTLSIGVSIFPKDSKNLWQCIKFSDVAMYKAKEAGRNRVVRFEPDMWTEESY